MDLDKLFEAFEKYSQEFIIYLLSFFKQGGDSSEEPFVDAKNKVILFSIMSAFVGSYLVNRYSQGAMPHENDLLNAAVNEVLWWTGAGAFMYFVMSRFPPRINVMQPMLVVFKVLPVAWIASGFTGYVIYSIADFFPAFKNIEYVTATWVSAIVYATMVLFYLPGSFPKFTTASPAELAQIKKQQRIGVTATIGLVMLIIVGREAGWTIRNWTSIVAQGTWLAAYANWCAQMIVWTAQHLAGKAA